MASLVIRSFTPNDKPAVAVLICSGVDSHTFLSPAYREVYAAHMKRQFAMAEVFLAEDEESGEVIGCIALADCRVAGVFVAPDKWGRGIGNLLVEHAYPREKKSLSAEVYEKNKRAILFFERCGFHIVDRKEHQETAEVVLLMAQKKEADKGSGTAEKMTKSVADSITDGIVEGVTTVAGLLLFGGD